MFQPYSADNKKLHYHIKECIRRSRTKKISYLKDYYDVQDLISDCWIYCLESDKRWAQEVRAWYNNREITCDDSNNRLRQRVKIAVKNYISLKYYKEKRKEKTIMEYAKFSKEEESYVPQINLKELLRDMNLSVDEWNLIHWKLGIIEQDEALSALRCKSKQTLHNKWDILSTKIKIRMIMD